MSEIPSILQLVKRPIYRQDVWRVRHPTPDTTIKWWVGFVVGVSDEPVDKTGIGLLGGDYPPADALEFGREVDARRFAQAYLSPGTEWIFDGPTVAPMWGIPPDTILLSALTQELDKPAEPDPRSTPSRSGWL